MRNFSRKSKMLIRSQIPHHKKKITINSPKFLFIMMIEIKQIDQRVKTMRVVKRMFVQDSIKFKKRFTSHTKRLSSHVNRCG